MAHSLSAQKRVRQNEAARARNRWRLRTMRDAIKDFNEKVLHGTADEAKAAMQKVAQIIDRTASKGVIHKNQAARRKSRLSSKLKGKQTSKPAAKAAKSK
ncbi:MAG: 30S ribosomal protein S20 [Phycisphaeraceae bacterium]|nr:30S ribosomal protein S20 [Phycisphaeraceae bacterium]